MIRHFFLDKTNSIIEGSLQNVGINPVLRVGYGNTIMRGLLHFDTCAIKELIEDKTFADTKKLTFNLKMSNCFGIDGIPYEKELFTNLNDKVERAASFDLILVEMPCEWDEGRGFDFISDFWIKNNRSYTIEGSNWYFAESGILWPYEEGLIDLNGPNLNWAERTVNAFGAKGGVFPFDFIKDEYGKYLNGEESVVVGSQHFDFGNENLSIDITKYVFNAIEKDTNYGLMLMFAPTYEMITNSIEQYVGFVTDKTNTFFHPYVEAVYDNYVEDDRESFTLNKKNKLYLYVSDEGEMKNLDEMPICTFEGKDMEVEQVTKGVYCIEVDGKGYTPDSICYDTWENIVLDGVELDRIELETAINASSRKIKIGTSSEIKNDLVPSLYGINDDEKLGRGEIREVTVDFRQKYNTDKKELIDGGEFRIYVKDGNREIDVIPYHKIERAYLNNFFMVYTEDLIPNEYFVDVKVNVGRERKFYKRVLRFTVVSNVTERYNQ